jgi:dTDP-L-rhamnose 4-epimerase
MRVLITGGAGFIGSHLADRRLADGYEVRALDNLEPQGYGDGERPDYLDEAVELQVGDARDHEAVGRALEGVDAVYHFAAAVGVGQSMYEIERYTSINAIGAAVVLEEVAKRCDAIGKLVVASSMSIYGEGQYRNPRTGETGIAPGLRPETQLVAKQWELLADDGGPLEPQPEIVEQYRAGDIRHCFADTRLAEEGLGFRSEIAFEEGMRDLLAWLEGQEAVDAVDAARGALVARGLAH